MLRRAPAPVCHLMRKPSWCTASSSRCGIWSGVYPEGVCLRSSHVPSPPSPVVITHFCHLFVYFSSFIAFHACRDESFVSYRTSTYKLHLFETVSGYRFVMLSDPNADSLRFIMRSIYTGPFLEYVVRNPLVPMDSRERGIDNEYFRASIDRLVRGLSIFQ